MRLQGIMIFLMACSVGFNLYFGQAFFGKKMELEVAKTYQQLLELGITEQKNLLQELEIKYQNCLQREKTLSIQTLILRKDARKNFQKVVDLNRERLELWRKKEKPKVRRVLSRISRRLDGFERLVTEFKWGSQTSLEYIEESDVD